MQELQVFNFNGFDVREITDQKGEPWFVAKDVCEILGYVNPSKAIADHVDDEDKLNNESLASLGQRGGWIINESGLYSLVLRSDKKEAKEFKRWVTSDVLPSIRKTGSYAVKQPTGQELIALALVEAQRFLAAKDEQIESMKPAVQFMTDVTGSRGAIEMSQAAKIIGMGYGRNQLFELLRKKGVLRSNNEPFQRYVDAGWFRLVEQKWHDAKGETHINIKTMVYQKGLDGIIKVIRSVSAI